MNDITFLDRPAFRCRVVRRWCALTGSAAVPHVHSCGDCRAYFQAAAALEHSLRSSVPAESDVASGLEQRILRAVRESTPAPQLSGRRRAAVWPAAVALPALAAAALVVLWPKQPAPRLAAQPVAVANASAVDAAAVVSAVESFSNRLVDTVIPTTAEFVATNPLQQEMDSLYADARSALGFLAMNFLPPASRENRPPRSG
jgi:hypothetical protein